MALYSLFGAQLLRHVISIFGSLPPGHFSLLSFALHLNANRLHPEAFRLLHPEATPRRLPSDRENGDGIAEKFTIQVDK